jgi:hypothetical protein
VFYVINDEAFQFQGQKEIILFKMVVTKSEVHTSPELVHHKCVITKWSEKSNALDMCHFDVPVWPHGLFDYPCDDCEYMKLLLLNNFHASK